MKLFTKAQDAFSYEIVADLSNLGKMVNAENLNPQDIKNASLLLRKLLIDKNLVKAVSSQKIKLRLRAPKQKIPPQFFSEQGITFLQHSLGRLGQIEIAFLSSGRAGNEDISPYLSGFETPQILKIDQFLNQLAFYYHGQIVSRGEVIKYMANKAGGAHYDDDQATEPWNTLRKIRQSVIFNIKGSHVAFEIQGSNFMNFKDDFIWSPECLDPLAVEIFSTSRLVIISESVMQFRQSLEVGT